MSQSKVIPFSELFAEMSPEARARVDARVRETVARLRLADIREAIGQTQLVMAAKLKLGQASVSKIESATDMYLSTLRRYIEALGGELVISAKFPEGTVIPIDSLSSAPKKARKRTPAKKKSSAAKVSKVSKAKISNTKIANTKIANTKIANTKIANTRIANMTSRQRSA
jgi:transcriptional regulator with XRE-family HTH domain